MKKAFYTATIYMSDGEHWDTHEISDVYNITDGKRYIAVLNVLGEWFMYAHDIVDRWSIKPIPQRIEGNNITVEYE